ncbi:MAG: hypothetical protein IJ150_10890 [Bacteroidales bacterium]|nr:hypothetical protein [Bacteroidales bacterium]
MKTIRLYAALVFAALTLASCDEEYGSAKLHTTINSDGSCSREINFTIPQPNGIILSNEWKNVPTKPEDGEKLDTTVTYARNFDNVEQLSQDMPLILNGKPLSSKATFQKRFHWFYTEYTFTEVFASIGGNFPIPLTNYADTASINDWFFRQPQLLQGMNGSEAFTRLTEIGQKMDKWLSDNLMHVGINYICNHYDSIKNPPVSREQFIQLGDSLNAFITQKAGNDFLVYDHQKGVQEFFNSNAYDIFFNYETEIGKDFSNQLIPLISFSNLSVPYALTMPGEIVNADNGYYSDGVISYILSGERLIPADYVITATSRQTNIWAYVVTAIVILLAIGSWVWKLIPKREVKN